MPFPACGDTPAWRAPAPWPPAGPALEADADALDARIHADRPFRYGLAAIIGLMVPLQRPAVYSVASRFLATSAWFGRWRTTEIFDPSTTTTVEPIMNRPSVIAVLAAVAATVALPMVVTPVQAQIEVQIGTPQPQPNGAWGDRDRDGIPNAYDQRNNNRQQARGDRDRDGVPNRYDTDRDGDGVPNTWDGKPGNPYRR